MKCRALHAPLCNPLTITASKPVAIYLPSIRASSPFGSTHHAASPSLPSSPLCPCRPVRSAPLRSAAHDAGGHGGSILGAGLPLTLSPSWSGPLCPRRQTRPPPLAPLPPPRPACHLEAKEVGSLVGVVLPPLSSVLAWSGDPSGRDSCCLVE